MHVFKDNAFCDDLETCFFFRRQVLAGEDHRRQIAQRSLVLHRLERFNLSVVPAGSPQPAAYELLNSARLESSIEEARRRYDYVLIDTPPLVPLPDCRLLAKCVDGFLLIVAAHRTPRKSLARALDMLDPSKLIGIVFNGDDASGSHQNSYYAYYTPQGRDRQRRRWWRRG